MAARAQPVRVLFKSPMALDVTVFMYSHETHTQHECCIRLVFFNYLPAKWQQDKIIT